ncbi:MAG: tetratricopeptide repeat protein [Saprospiraceae bacterium]|nr:tetratricopeptide repeat protein [Saprospiraceae bacterium]
MATNDKENKEVENKNVASGEFDFDEFRSQASNVFEKNKNIIIGAFAIILILIVGLYYYFVMYKGPMQEDAQINIYKAQAQMERGSQDIAVGGDENVVGFTEIIEEYSGTPAANNAHYQIGVAMMKRGDYDKAITFFSEYSSNDPITQALAYGLLGDAYSSLAEPDVEKALAQYEKAANHTKNEAVASQFLRKAGLWCEVQNQLDKAADFYKRLKKEYPQAAQQMSIEKDIIRVTKQY